MKDEYEFMERMVASFDDVHNGRYWEEVTPFIKERAGGVVLDLGCGPGLLLAEIDQRFSPQKLIGVDLSQVMLDRAKEFLSYQFDQGKVELIKQHLQEDPDLPRNIDLLVSSRVLRSFEDQEAIFRSIYKSLIPGGRLVLLDWARANLETYATWFARSRDQFKDLPPADVIRYHRNFSRYSLDDWVYILSNFGFKPLHTCHLNEVILLVIAEK